MKAILQIDEYLQDFCAAFPATPKMPSARSPKASFSKNRRRGLSQDFELSGNRCLFRASKAAKSPPSVVQSCRHKKDFPQPHARLDRAGRVPAPPSIKNPAPAPADAGASRSPHGVFHSRIFGGLVISSMGSGLAPAFVPVDSYSKFSRTQVAGAKRGEDFRYSTSPPPRWGISRPSAETMVSGLGNYRILLADTEIFPSA